MDVLSDSVSSDINTRVNTINAMASTISSGIKSHFNSISQSIDHISRRLNNDDDANIGDDNQMLNTLWINIVCGAALIIIFESCRGMKSIFLKRLNKKFLKLRRVPPQPSPYPLFWIRDILKISDEEVLRMIGLDGYMLLRYLKILFRVALFFSVCGALVLVPVYQAAPGDSIGWNRFTLANIPNNERAIELWAPVLFSYLFSAFFCQLMYKEYKAFVQKRVEYLVRGDADTPVQTYYTIIVERLPSALRAAPLLHQFFEKLFPGEVYSVEVALDVNELEALAEKRRSVRNRLEKAIAIMHATSRRPKIWIGKGFYKDTPNDKPEEVDETWFSKCLGYEILDEIEHQTLLLNTLNNAIESLQKVYYDQRQKLSELEGLRLVQLQKKLTTKASGVVDYVKEKVGMTIEPDEMTDNSLNKTLIDYDNLGTISVKQSAESPLRNSLEGTIEDKNRDAAISTDSKSSSAITMARKVKGAVLIGVEELAKEGLKTTEVATRGALRGVLEATRTLELLTVGAYYKVSSTAFVTLKSRVATSCTHQMLLSHSHHHMLTDLAPNPMDIIWENVSIPIRQIKMRSAIGDGVLMVGAVFWSTVVTFIVAVSNVDSIARVIPSIQQYSDTPVYKFLNNYLAIILLLILLSILPFIFDFIARSYEGRKLESEIQNSIMTRYFYYQLANVFVSVGLGSIASSLHQILDSPSSILSILGGSVPSFSIYFANLIIVKTLTAIPLEMLRVWPLLGIGIVEFFTDKDKCTRRELRTGIFADPPMWYGWIYPNILMVVMIMVTYSCIAPFLMPFCALYFAFAFLMYKYQLLYVYINDYQSGGFMWYAVFNRSMLALVCGVFTLVCYLAIRMTFMSGPLYFTLPLPFLIILFWRYCEDTFKDPTLNLSLEGAQELDRRISENKKKGKPVPQDLFNPARFRQPSLAEGKLKPSPYRREELLGEARKSMMEGDEESGTPLSDNSDISPILRDEMPTLAMEQIAPNFPELSAIPSIEPTLGQLQQQQYDLSGDGTDEDDDDPERESLLDDFLKKKKQGGLRNSIDTLDGQNSLNIDVARDKRSKFNRASTGVIGKTNKKEGSPMFQLPLSYGSTDFVKGKQGEENQK